MLSACLTNSYTYVCQVIDVRYNVCLTLLNVDYQRLQDEIDHREQELSLRVSDLERQQRHLEEEFGKIARERIALLQLRVGVKITTGYGELPATPVPGITEHVRKLFAEATSPHTNPDPRFVRSCGNKGCVPEMLTYQCP